MFQRFVTNHRANHALFFDILFGSSIEPCLCLLVACAVGVGAGACLLVVFCFVFVLFV